MNYDVRAKSWDDERRSKRAVTIAAKISEHIPAGCKSAMEFGCGTGLISFALTGAIEKTLLVDSSQGMIDEANKKITAAGLESQMQAVKVDLAGNETLCEQFDFIYSSMVFHHIQDVKALIIHLKRLMNAGGCICVVDLCPDDGSFHKTDPDFNGHDGFDTEAFGAMFFQAGFLDVKCDVFYEDVKIIGEEKVPYALFCLSAQS